MNVAIARKILSIKVTGVNSLISFGSNRLNVDISFNNKNKGVSEFKNSNIIEISERIFELFAATFSNLYRTNGITQGSLEGYKYIPNGKYAFILKSIPRKIYDKVYEDVLNRWKGSQSQETNFIIDWKYYSYHIFDNPNYRNDKRVNTSIIKSLAYEFCLSQVVDEPINNQFCIPFYDINENDVVIDSKPLNCNINLIRMNFRKIQEIYLNG